MSSAAPTLTDTNAPTTTDTSVPTTTTGDSLTTDAPTSPVVPSTSDPTTSTTALTTSDPTTAVPTSTDDPATSLTSTGDPTTSAATSMSSSDTSLPTTSSDPETSSTAGPTTDTSSPVTDTSTAGTPTGETTSSEVPSTSTSSTDSPPPTTSSIMSTSTGTATDSSTPTSVSTSTSDSSVTTSTDTTDTTSTGLTTTTSSSDTTSTTSTTSQSDTTTTTQLTTTTNDSTTTTSNDPTTTTSNDPTTSINSSPTTSSSVPPPTSLASDTSSTVSTTSSSSSSTSISAQTTLSTTFFVSTTDSEGRITSTAPAVFTSTFTSESSGSLVTVTQTVANAPGASLSTDNGSSHSTSQFFSNKGAVAGVFLIVGLAVASVCLWIAFAVRRSRKRRRLEHEAAMVGPQGHRSPLEDEDDVGPSATISSRGTVPMAQRSSSSMPFAAMGAASPPSALYDRGGADNIQGEGGPYDPYAGYTVPPGAAVNPFTLNRAAKEGYVPARTSSPPLASGSGSGGADAGPAPQPGSPNSVAFAGLGRQPSDDGKGGSSGNTSEGHYHSRSISYSSYEPLLVASGLSTGKTPPATPAMGAVRAPTPPPRSPYRPSFSGGQEIPSGERDPSSTSLPHTGEVKTDDRLDPALLSRLHRTNTRGSSGTGLRDDEDYSRPVLGVRNLPENASISEYSDD